MAVSAISAFIGRLTRIPDGVASKDRKNYSVLAFVLILGNIAHILYMLLFWLSDVHLMFYFNILSLLVWSGALFVFYRFKAYALAVSIGTIEYIAHQCLGAICLGSGAGFQSMLVLAIFIPFLTVPIRRLRLAFGLSLLAFLAFVALNLSVKGIDPLYIVPETYLFGLHGFSILFTGIGSFWGAYFFVGSVKKAEDKADFEFERAEALLRNILPSSIAERLKNSPTTIADGFDCATVLFCDIVDFTRLSETRTPSELVSLLNELFSRFDLVAERQGLEKIKTIGDAYMVASGIPERCEDNAHSIAEFALEIQGELASFNKDRQLAVELRVGINSGPVVAGVIGRKKFIYDLWGDAVNMASRMESHGVAGKIQVTEDTKRLLEGDYELEARGMIEVKGKGLVPAWFLKGRRTKVLGG